MSVLEKIFWTWLLLSMGAILCYGIEIEKDKRGYRWMIVGVWLTLGALLGLYRIWFH